MGRRDMIRIELRIGNRMTGFTAVQDSKWPSMYRVRSPNGELSDMVNLTRAKEAAVRFARPRGLGGGDVAYWDSREIGSEAPPMRFSEPQARVA